MSRKAALIPAYIQTDDNSIRGQFESLPWFAEKATDADIIELFFSYQLGGAAGDAIAYHCHKVSTVPTVSAVFDYLTNPKNRYRLRDSKLRIIGFEVAVIEKNLMYWLREHKNDLWTKIYHAKIDKSKQRQLITGSLSP